MNKVNILYDDESEIEEVDNIEHHYTWTSDVSTVVWLPTPPDTIAPLVSPSETTFFTAINTIDLIYTTDLTQTCQLTDTVTIIVLPEMIPPSGFSPNDDGFNDEWKLPVTTNDDVLVQIYNRWGGLVWEVNGDYATEPWTGDNVKGKVLPSGTYYYVIIYDTKEGTKKISGPVTILR